MNKQLCLPRVGQDRQPSLGSYGAPRDVGVPAESLDFETIFPTLNLRSKSIMASKALKLSVGGKEVGATLESKIGKDDLYGRVDHLVEQNGRRLERGWLLPDGSTFRKSQVAATNVDEE